MHTSQMIKSKFWRAVDLQGQPPVVLTIAEVTEELLGRGTRQDMKCFLWFKEHLKGLQLNKNRVRLLEAAYGPDSEMWVGKRVRLSYDPLVEFGGRPVGGVKLQTPPGIVFTPGPSAAAAGWGEVPATAPPPPVWDPVHQRWNTSSAPVQSPPPTAPPPPVWNVAANRWETVNPQTGEIAPPPPPPPTRALTIGERVNAGQEEDFTDDIPF